jgi:catechol 2,3-dioxygenase-like lactoylglutathione lyase family enzyme
MEIESRERAALDLLTDRRAGAIAHPGGTLLDHLIRVRARLLDWGEPTWVVLAGLTHAAYGTDGFPASLLGLPERAVLRGAIGELAERMVYLYCSCDRDSLYPYLASVAPSFTDRFTGLEHRLGTRELRCLIAITAANELDVVTHHADLMASGRDELWELFRRMRRHLTAPAWRACVAAVAPPGWAAALSDPSPIRLSRPDHLVLTVRDLDATMEWYRVVLGMEVVTFGDGRRALSFGAHKINLHQSGHEYEPKAARPMPGSADVCLISDTPLTDVVDHLHHVGVPIEHGPVARTGATGPITSVYVRDPDGNLVEISVYDGDRPAVTTGAGSAS